MSIILFWCDLTSIVFKNNKMKKKNLTPKSLKIACLCKLAVISTSLFFKTQTSLLHWNISRLVADVCFYLRSNFPVFSIAKSLGGATFCLNLNRELAGSTHNTPGYLAWHWTHAPCTTHTHIHASSHLGSWERGSVLMLCLFCTVSYLNVSFSRDS